MWAPCQGNCSLIDLGLQGRSIIAGFTVVFAVGVCRRSMGFKREASPMYLRSSEVTRPATRPAELNAALAPDKILARAVSVLQSFQLRCDARPVLLSRGTT